MTDRLETSAQYYISKLLYGHCRYWQWVTLDNIHLKLCLHFVVLQSHTFAVWELPLSTDENPQCVNTNTVEPLWKGQECLTKVAKFGPFPCTILYNSCLFYPSWQPTSFERPPSWVAFIEGFHCSGFNNNNKKSSVAYSVTPTYQHTEAETKMAVIFQTTFSNGFLWMKMHEFRIKFHWSLFLGVQLTIFQRWFR